MGRDPQTLGVFLTTPGIVYRDMIITGFRTGEGRPAAAHAAAAEAFEGMRSEGPFTPLGVGRKTVRTS